LRKASRLAWSAAVEPQQTTAPSSKKMKSLSIPFQVRKNGALGSLMNEIRCRSITTFERSYPVRLDVFETERTMKPQALRFFFCCIMIGSIFLPNSIGMISQKYQDNAVGYVL
jgi:hypothetical protein